MEDPSSFQDDDQFAQLQPVHSGGFPNPLDYYCQDIDWRAQQPSACEGEFCNLCYEKAPSKSWICEVQQNCSHVS